MTDLDLGALLDKAQRLREQMDSMQKGLASRTVEGTAGGGMVRVVATGELRISKIEIEPTVLTEDRGMVQDLVVAAVNAALDKARNLAQEQLSSLVPPELRGSLENL